MARLRGSSLPRYWLAPTVAALLVGCSSAPDESKDSSPAPVRVARVVKKDVPVQLSAVGNVEALTTVEVRARVAGQLKQVHFTEGDFVKENDLLFTIDPAPIQAALDGAKATLAKDEAQAREAVRERDRNASLLDDTAVSRETYQRSVARAESTAAQVLVDRAAVEKAKLDLQYCTIRSPLTGATGRLLVDQGNLIQDYGPRSLVEITQVQPIYVTFSLPERNLAEVQKYRAAGPLKVQAHLPGAGVDPEDGTVTFVNNKVDTRTGTITLRGTFENKHRRLWPGQFVEAALTLRTEPGALLVPARAVGDGPHGTFVYVLKDDQTAEVRPVVQDRVVGEQAVIRSGLQDGETVVTEGQLRLHPGAQVKAQGE
jgi:multidrug efflux system membrane fusion protein